MHGYVHFAKFGGPMNNVVGPQKKPSVAKNHFQYYPNSHYVF